MPPRREGSRASLAAIEPVLTRIFNSARDMMLLGRVEPGVLFRVVAVNRQYVETMSATGHVLEAGDLEGRTFDELMALIRFDPATIPQERERYAGVIRNGGSVEYDELDRTPTGNFHGRTTITSIPDESGGCAFVLYSSQDVTAARQAEQALRESEAKFATAFQASPMALTLTELATGRVIEVNSAFERISGHTRAEAIGRTSLELGLWGQADREEYVNWLRRDGHVRGRVLTFRTRAGRSVQMRVYAEMIAIGGERCVLAVLEDISDQRRAEEHNAALEAQLRQNQKLEALGTLAGGIAHDFNNILTAIVINQELALMDVADPTEVRHRLAEIGQASSRAKELVRQILTFSRQQQHERLRQNLQTTVHEALSLVRASLPATIEIVQELSLDAPAVMADAGQVHQVVMNLCTNAAHAMRDRPGRLTVRLDARVLDEATCRDLPPLRPGLHAVLEVADTGHGMEPAVVARIFEPFFTTKGPGEGTGLGLPMVHGIMRDHEGGVFVRSQPGVGTTFELFFPAATEAAAARPVFDTSIVRGHGESVLVVDDEPAIGAAVGAMLGKLGYRVETFSDPEDALARFTAAPGGFDLVLTDRTMPRVTGPDLIAALHRLRPEVPALLMSGLNSAEDAAAIAGGGYGLVAKPLEIGPLSRVVRQTLDAAARPT